MRVIHTNDPSVINLARFAFPSYNGRTYKVKITNTPVSLTSYWSEGSKDYHRVINLETHEVIEVPENGTIFNKNFENQVFPCPGVAVITYSIVQGRDFGITISIHPDNMNQLSLPEPVKLTTDELIVLYATRSLKSSYGGRSNYRFYESKASTGITEERWNIALESLIEKGFLNKRKAITNEGKNALTHYNINSFYAIKQLLKNEA